MYINVVILRLAIMSYSLFISNDLHLTEMILPNTAHILLAQRSKPYISVMTTVLFNKFYSTHVRSK